VNLAVLTGPWAVLLALAAFRLTRLWVDDTLPPLPRIRKAVDDWAIARWDRAEHAALARDRVEFDSGTPRLRKLRERHMESGNQPPITYLVTCYWCAGFWIGLAVVLVAVLVPVAVWAVPVAALALSAITGLLAQFTD